MDFAKLKNCKKGPSAGGFTREQVNQIAREMGIDPSKYKKKDELCDEILIRAGRAQSVPGRSPLRSTLETLEGQPVKTNHEIATQLRKLADFYAKQNDRFRATAFRNSANIIEKFPNPITSPAQLKGIPGIKEGTINRVTELFTTGQLAELPPEEDRDQIIAELATLFQIGEVKARELADQGVQGIEDLVEKFNNGLVNLTDAQQVGLEYYLHFKERIPREEVGRIGDYVLDLIESLDEATVGDIVGSYRYQSPTSGDIDILITNNNDVNPLSEVINHLQKNKFLQHILSQGPVKFQGTYFSSFPDNTNGILRKIDIRYVEPENWGAALVHATGPENFNRELRKGPAKAIGLSLSEHGLKNKETGERIPVASEEEVFNILGLSYIPPVDRPKFKWVQK